MERLSKSSISILNKNHDRNSFYCGNEKLDNYLHKQAMQDLKRGLAAVFVLQGVKKDEITAFYSLSSLSIDSGDLTLFESKKLPQKRPIPCTLLGQFAVHSNYQNKGIAGWLLVYILHQTLKHSDEIGSFALIVDAVDESAKKYWLHCGFIPFPNTPSRLFAPLKTIRKWLAV